jgi:hypothetical protein
MKDAHYSWFNDVIIYRRETLAVEVFHSLSITLYERTIEITYTAPLELE